MLLKRSLAQVRCPCSTQTSGLYAEAAKNSSDAKKANSQNSPELACSAQVSDTGEEALFAAGFCRRERLIPKCTGRSWQQHHSSITPQMLHPEFWCYHTVCPKKE